MNLIIDVGNTTIKLDAFKNNIHQKGIRVKHSEFTAAFNNFMQLYSFSRCIVSNVGNHSLNAVIENSTIPYIMLNSKTKLPFDVKYKTPATLGNDRIAAAAGAYFLYPGFNTLVIDAGTAITYDFMDAQNIYHGGNIAPGINMRFRALHEFTHALPLAEASSNFSVTGQSTIEAITGGVQQGILFEIEGYINLFSVQYPNLRVIMTGGDTLYFEDKLKKFIFVEPNLVAIGLNTILEYNAE